MQSTAPEHIHYTVYEPDRIPAKAVMLLLHGMQEHSGRYEAFAVFLKAQGYVVATYDHTGHGRTAKTKEQLGFFRRKKPDDLLVSEAQQMSLFMLNCFPDLPLILMGHSMGSFVARCLLQRSAKLFDGVILMGTGGPNPLAALFRPILSLTNLVASTKRSKWLNKLFTSINNKKFKNEKPNDGTNWLSISLANRKAFQNDELCGIDFSNNAFYGLISMNVKATGSNWADNIPSTLPLLFVSGAEDPIGDFGKGVQRTVKALRQKEFEHVDIKLYPHMRHEILNEDDRKMVFQDIAEWLGKIT